MHARAAAAAAKENEPIGILSELCKQPLQSSLYRCWSIALLSWRRASN